jgi:ferritin-like metal-binding protein YciE
MLVKNPREIFVMLLSDLRQNTERSAKFINEISQQAQDPDVKEALDSRAWITEKDLAAIDKCFQMIGERPAQLSGRLEDMVVEDFRKEVAEIQNPAAKLVFLLSKVNRLIHLRVAEYEVLVEAADLSGHYGVGVLLESCLADKLVFIERTRRMIRKAIETRIAARATA